MQKSEFVNWFFKDFQKYIIDIYIILKTFSHHAEFLIYSVHFLRCIGVVSKSGIPAEKRYYCSARQKQKDLDTLNNRSAPGLERFCTRKQD